MKIQDTYKAAYFMTQGARIVDVEIKKSDIRHAILHKKTWVCILDNIPPQAVQDWDSGNAIVNVDDFRRERLRIKRLAIIKRGL